jgi:SAM-dependent methyltransferase
MLDLIEKLPPGSRVLDLGAGPGSFRTDREDLVVVRLDLEVPASRNGGCYVSADAAKMPFASAAFDLVVSNHSLEHFAELEPTVRETGRVMRPGGTLYIAVPNAATLTDRIYRWLARGGGHVNPFRKPEEVISLVNRLAGLPHGGTRILYSSLSFLNAHNFRTRPPRKILLFANGNERVLAILVWSLRLIDRHIGTRLSQYGWSFYFGASPAPHTDQNWVNVCVRCGSGHSEGFLKKKGAVPPLQGWFKWYRCPMCKCWNVLTYE